MQDAAIVEAIEHAAVDRVDELSALYRLTDRLYRAKLADDVYEAALDAIVGTLGCERASILLFNDQASWTSSPGAACRSITARPCAAIRRGSLATAIRSRSSFRTSIETDESDAVKATILAEGIRALGFIPLVANGVVVGKFMSYYPEPRQFAEHEIELAVDHCAPARLQHRAHARRGRAPRRRGGAARVRGALQADVRACAGDDLDERCARRLPALEPDAARVLGRRRGQSRRLHLEEHDAPGRRRSHRRPDHGRARTADERHYRRTLQQRAR